MFNLKTISIVCAYLFCATSFAQTAPLPSDAEIAKQKQQITESFNQLNGKNTPTPTQRAAQAAIQGKSYGATVDAVNAIKGNYQSASSASKEQFEQLARSRMPLQRAKVSKGESDLMIFVSFSMPNEMLINYVKQAKRFGAVLMMRGFINDKMSTTRAAIERMNSEGVEWQISPEPFKKFKVVKVPSVVLASADDAQSVTQDGCATPDAYTLISGDIQLFDALDKMSLRAQPKIAKLAKSRLLADRASGGQGGLIR